MRPYRRLALPLFLALAFVSAAYARPPAAAPDLDPRSLPSLVVRWECHCNAAGMTVADGAVVIQEYRRIFALDAETHELLWDRKLEESPGSPQEPLVLEGRVVAAWEDRLLVLDSATGVEIADLTFDGRVTGLVGPPLAAVVTRPAGEGSRDFFDEVIRIDPESGLILARREVDVMDLEAVPGSSGVPPRLLAVSFGPRGVPIPHREGRLLELSGDDLSTLRSWPGAISHVIPHQGPGDLGLLLVPFGSRPDAFLVRPYEVASGELGPLLPRPREDGFLHDLEVDLQATSGSDPTEPQAVRRLDPETGRVLWRTALPARAGGWARDGDLLHLHTIPSGRGRGLLLTLDWATGEIVRRAYGLRDVLEIERWQDRLILRGRDGVVAVAADELGPPEAEVRPVELEVERILERLNRSSFADQAASQDLLVLGEGALPILAARFEELPVHSATVVAGVFAQAGYQPAARLIARRLVELPGAAGLGDQEGPDPRLNAARAFLHALGRIGGPEQVEIVATVLLDEERPLASRERAAFALVAMGAEVGLAEVLPWIDRFYERRQAEREIWWERVRTIDSWWSFAGLEPPSFGDTARPLAEDRDRDGLPDRVEAALGTDPGATDTDGDELSDPVDPAPLGGAEPISEDDRIRLAVVRHWATFRSEGQDVPLCVVSERPLEWSDGGRGHVLLPVQPGVERETCLHLDPHPAGEEARAEHDSHYGPLLPGERLWLLDEGSGWAAQGSWVVVRQVGDRWLVRDLSLWWIS